MNQHWPDIAKKWSHVGSPLRPCGEDLIVIEDVIRNWPKDRAIPRVMILGVTQELYRLPWPAGTSIVAVDHTQAMIDSLWMGPREDAICAEWTDIPVEAGSRDMILCDGGLTVLAHPDREAKLVSEIRRILSPGGLCIFRFYVPLAVRESPRAVLNDFLGGRIVDLSALKVRLGMAMQDDVSAGVRLGDVWEAIRQAAPDFAAVAEKIGWPLDHLSAINTYRDSDVRYWWVDLANVQKLFCENPGGFEIESIHTPKYPLGDRCPTVIFRRSK